MPENASRDIGLESGKPVCVGGKESDRFAMRETQYRITLQSIGDAVIATDREGRVTTMNATAERLTGWALPEAGGRKIEEVFNIVNSTTRVQVSNPVDKVIATGNVVGLANHTSLISRDGREFQISDSGAPIKDDSGKTLGVVLVFSDITKTYELQEQIRKNEERLAFAIDAADEGIWDLNPQTNERYLSPRTFELVGLEYDPENNLKQNDQWLSMIHPEDAPWVSEVLGDLLTGRIPSFATEYRIQHVKGHYLWLYATGKVVQRDENGNCVRATGIVRDITERKEIELKLKASEARLRAAQKAGKVGVVSFHVKSGILQLSEELRTLRGLPKTEYSVKEALALIHEEDRQGFQQLLQMIQGGLRTADIEYRGIDQNLHKYVWNHMRAQVEMDEKGRPVSILGTVVDISERKENEQHLEHVNSILQSIRAIHRLFNSEIEIPALLEKSVELLKTARGFNAAWIMQYDETGAVEHFASAGFENSSEELRNILIVANAPRILEVSQFEDGVYSAAFPPKYEYRNLPIHSEGKVPSYICSIPLRREEFLHGYLVVAVPKEIENTREERMLLKEIGEDIGQAIHGLILEREKKVALDELLKAKEEAESANNAKSEFLAMMSHEMRTPLNPILGYAMIMKDEVENGDHRKFLDAIIDSSEQLLAVINQILEYSRLTHQHDAQFPHQSVKLLEVCDTLTRVCSMPGEKVQFFLVSEIPGLLGVTQDLTVEVNWDLLKKALMILLSNAFKYTVSGQVTLAIGVEETSSHELDWIHFHVSDTGSGIEADKLDLLFKPFVQADTSYSRAHGGVGLGLATTQKITEILGGSIEVVSEVGKGSTFKLRIPTKGCSGKIRERPLNNRPIQLDISHIETRKPLRGKRILIVDDNHENSQFLSIVARKSGADVVCASSGFQAIEIANETRFDLIFMDIAMPGIDGLETMRRLKSESIIDENCPVIVVSAHVLEEDIAKSMAAGAADYLCKPINVRQLLDCILRSV